MSRRESIVRSQEARGRQRARLRHQQGGLAKCSFAMGSTYGAKILKVNGVSNRFRTCNPRQLSCDARPWPLSNKGSARRLTIPMTVPYSWTSSALAWPTKAGENRRQKRVTRARPRPPLGLLQEEAIANGDLAIARSRDEVDMIGEQQECDEEQEEEWKKKGRGKKTGWAPPRYGVTGTETLCSGRERRECGKKGRGEVFKIFFINCTRAFLSSFE